MKLAYITTVYEDYLDKFYAKYPNLDNQSYNEQKIQLNYDAFGWADFWSNALHSLGYETLEITLNIEKIQRQWALENGLSFPQSIPLKTIALQQLKLFQPEILWFDNHDYGLLKEIRQEIPSIRLVLGWSGSAIPQTNVWQLINVVLSCAPESVAYFQDQGLTAKHLHHAFEPRINNRLQMNNKNIDLCFIGQIMRSSDFHLFREKFLEELASKIPITIFSNSANYTYKSNLKAMVKMLAYDVIKTFENIGFSQKELMKISGLSEFYQSQFRPVLPVSPKLIPFLKPAVYGLEMYQALRNTKISLNIHADSSPIYASNMRLFESPGVGTCLLTDWKENLPELFEPDTEIVTYRSVDECVEKVQWLLAHPQQREAIAKAGQARTLKDHTFAQRAIQLDEIIHNALS